VNQRALPMRQLCDLAILAALDAGQFVQATDRTQLERTFKAAGGSPASQLVTEVDIRSEAIIRQHLQPTFEEWDIAFLGEESSQGVSDAIQERLRKPYHWCVDPLDGTLAFVEGTPGYAISIALVDRSGTALIGVVYDPVDATLWHAIRGQGSFRERAPIVTGTSGSTSLLVFADRSFSVHERYADLLDILNNCAEDLGLNGVDVVYGAGAVKNALQVLEHPAACYLKLPRPVEGGGSVWDFAATACIVGEAGGWCSNVHGDPLELNPRGATFMNRQGVLFALNEQIARYLIDRLQAR
jgi:fructose-1,6-bisphosphatase/inositol monophosphatase family enzyme